MAWQDSAISLLGVAVGGGIAAAAGSRSARRANTAAALRALADMRSLRATADPQEAGLPDRDLIRRARGDLLIGGAPWVLVEMHERATYAALSATWSLSGGRDAESERQRMYVQAVFHPSRFLARPILRLGDLLEQAMAESLERPSASVILGPWRRVTLRREVSRVANENEVTRYPDKDGDRSDWLWQELAVLPVTRWLTWPKRRALRSGHERSEQDENWYPKSARRGDEA
jgi:hypothetical protein